MLPINLDSIRIDQLAWPLLSDKQLSCSVMRLDEIHPLISGNKWFKLQYYLADAEQLQKTHLVSFGGAWSNHILAVAAAAQLKGFRSTGIIRGEEAKNVSNTLLQARELGMQLVFLSREHYSAKKLPIEFDVPEVYIIAEGGYGHLGAKGASTILSHTNIRDYTHIICATGTGTMLAGLCAGANPNQQVVGISILKGHYSVDDNIRQLTNDKNNFVINHDYHFGGYAKHTRELISFMNEFFLSTNIPSDFVYTGKFLFGMQDLIAKNYFPAGSKILAIHSGGLQGNVSLSPGTLIF